MTGTYLSLGVAITMEVIGTSALKLSDGFDNVLPGLVTLVAYLGSFYFLSLSLRELPIGAVYATWSAFGIVGAATVGIVFFDEPIDLAGIVGMGLVIAGVATLNLLSTSYSPA